MIEKQIDQDLKQAMLDRDPELVSALRNLKSTFLYYKIANNIRDQVIPDQQIIALLSKESKKRQESADLFKSGGNEEKANQELKEKQIIEAYLPAMLSEVELVELVDSEVQSIGNEKSNMGLIIKSVKEKSNGAADGALIAKLVQERLN